MATEKRRSEEFYTTSGRQVVGFECEGHPDVWWVPSEGTSQTVGYHLFKDKKAALEKGRAVLLTTIADAEKRLREIEAELAAL